MIFKNETQDTRFIILSFLGNTSKDCSGKDEGAAEAPGTESYIKSCL